MKFTLSGLVILSIFSVLLACALGSSHISLNAALTQSSSTAHEIFLYIRLPRALSAFVVGGLLALAGCFLQILLKNPLADPYVLGISGGASTANMIALLLGFTSYFALTAFCGSLISMFLVYLLASRQWGRDRLLLIGIILASFWGALMSFLISTSSNAQVRDLLFWLMGDLSNAHMPYLGIGILIIGIAFGMIVARALNVLSLGDYQAKALGVKTQSLQYQLYFLSSLLTAIAVTLAGPIGFVGLIVPHLLRLMGINDHRALIPACALAGGSLLCIADLLSRTILAPSTIPVGVMMAFIGLPIFLFLLLKGSGSC